MGGVTELGNMVKGLVGLAIVFKSILGEVVVPSDTIVKLTGSIVIIPFHGWVVLEEVLELGQFENSGLVWKG